MSFNGTCKCCKEKKIVFHFNELCSKCWDKDDDCATRESEVSG